MRKRSNKQRVIELDCNLKEEKEKNDKLLERLKVAEEKVKVMEREAQGDCVPGVHCKYCTYGVEGAWLGISGLERATVCLKNVKCKKFERKWEPKERNHGEDVVEVVRCKDCVYGDTRSGGDGWLGCDKWGEIGIRVRENGFCADGVKKKS